MYVRKDPKLTWKPITSMRWGWKSPTLRTEYGRRYFLFGVVPVWTVKPKANQKDAANG